MNKLSYNQLKLINFIFSVLIVLAYALEMAAGSYIPEVVMETGIIFILIVYSLNMILSALVLRNGSKILTDELSRQNEAKASQFTFVFVTIIIFSGLIINRITEKDILLGYNMLICMMFAVSAFKDGCYLWLEKGGGNAGN